MICNGLWCVDSCCSIVKFSRAAAAVRSSFSLIQANSTTYLPLLQSRFLTLLSEPLNRPQTLLWISKLLTLMAYYYLLKIKAMSLQLK